MPRVHTKTKSKAGKEYRCGRCAATIEPGERYFSWEFRYGGVQRRCKLHRPRPSELTQSKLSEVYAAQEGVEDALAEDFSQGDIESAIEEAVAEIEAVAAEYRDAAEAMGDAGGENEERADEVDGAAEAYQSVTVPERDEYDSDEAWREGVREEVGGVEVGV